MLDGPVYRRSQDFGALPVDLPTEEINNWLNYDAAFVSQLDLLAKDVFKRTRNTELVRDSLIHFMQQYLVDEALKLRAPYQGLILITLEDVDWDNVVDPFVSEWGGPQYFDEEEEEKALFDYFDRALHAIP